MLATDVLPPWRRLLRVSVRGLIIAILAIGSWLGWIVRCAHIQRDAVAAIESSRGHVAYDWDVVDRDQIMRRKPWAPRWFVDLVGVDFFGHCTSVRLNRIETDTVMAQVGRLAQLDRLTVSATTLSDGELTHLKDLTNLDFLSLDGTHVSDVGLAHLNRLTKLSSLNLRGTRVSNNSLAQLKALTKLSSVDLSDTHVADGGLTHLKGLTNLS
jgi:hypothetical protein